MKSALIRVHRKPGERRGAGGHVRGRVSGLVRRLAAGGPSVGLGRKARSESPSPGGQGDSKSHDTRASLTHYQRVWGTSRFDAESLLEKQLMKYLEWGPSSLSLPRVTKRMSTAVYRYPPGRQAPVETVREFMATVPGQIGRTARVAYYCPPSITKETSARSRYIFEIERDFLRECGMKYKSIHGSMNVKNYLKLWKTISIELYR